MATGSTYVRHYPAFKGLHDYEGILAHSSAFPDEGFDFKGKRVAVIGQGATGVQIVQELAPQNVDLTVFVRTPNIALPMVQRKVGQDEQRTDKSFYAALFKQGREGYSGFAYDSPTEIGSAVDPEVRDAMWEYLWSLGGFAFNAANYMDYLFDENMNDLMYEFWLKKTRLRMRDGYKRDIFAPLKKPHPFGTKRPSLEQNYYECLDKDTVSAVDLSKTPIDHFTTTGIVTTDGKFHEFDVVVLATGYDSFIGSLTSMGLRGKDGIDLKDRWKEGCYTWLGLTAPGNPNMFMLYSPQGEF